MMFYGISAMRRIACELQTSPSKSYYADWCDEVAYKDWPIHRGEVVSRGIASDQ